SILAAVESAGARRQAERNANQERILRADADREKKNAEASAEENRSLLAQQYVSNGTRLLDEGDMAGALVWFAEALRRDAAHPERERLHRIRFAATWQQCPRPVHIWFHDGFADYVEFSRDGKYVL